MSATPFASPWPRPPSGSALSVRDVGLLDLARHVAMRAALPLGSIEADTRALWGILRDKADDLGPDLDRDAAVDALEPFAHEWAKARAAHHQAATEEV